MKNITNLAVAFCATVTLLFVGCGSSESLVSVSGKVTAGGQPLAGVRVVFNPLKTEGNNNPGTWSQGLTNAQGEFTLTNRYGKPGACVGNHAVAFEYDDVDPDDMEELEEELEEAQEEGTREEFDAVKKRMQEINQLTTTRPTFSEDFEINFTVPSGGTKEANFAVNAGRND